RLHHRACKPPPPRWFEPGRKPHAASTRAVCPLRALDARRSAFTPLILETFLSGFVKRFLLRGSARAASMSRCGSPPRATVHGGRRNRRRARVGVCDEDLSALSALRPSGPPRLAGVAALRVLWSAIPARSARALRELMLNLLLMWPPSRA